MIEIRTDIFLGDSKEMLKKLPDNSVDLIVTLLLMQISGKAPMAVLLPINM